ncbi:MAG: hypothetical protein Q9216_003330 [Gyalolechia sp. 2 TL-2023]
MAKAETPANTRAKTIMKTEKTTSVECQDFNLEALAWAIQNGLSNSCLERYLKIWPASRIKRELCQPVGGLFGTKKFPILFFAVERNSPEIIRVLCRAGADPSQRAEPSGLPVLAYCILGAEYELCDTSDSLFTLQANGGGSIRFTA